MTYCAKDVFATYEVFKKLTKIYSERLVPKNNMFT